MLDLLKTLCCMDGPSGAEDVVREFIRSHAAHFADDIRTDAMGNLMVFRKGIKHPAKPVMLCAHMDEVGFIIKRITNEGMLKFGFTGGVDPLVALGRAVRFGQVKGIVGIKAVHLTTASEREHMPKTKDLYIDIGVTSKDEALAKVQPGDYGTFDSDIVEFGDGLLKAKAIDDRFGCAVLLALLRDKPLLDTWFVFTVQEEAGLRGAATAAFALRPDLCLVVEGTTAADLAEVPPHKQVCALGKGAVIPFMDGRTIYDEGLFDMLRQAAETQDIPWQTKHMIAGGTDAGRIHMACAGARTVGLAVPVRYIHSPVSTAALSDMRDVYALARAFLEGIAQSIE